MSRLGIYYHLSGDTKAIATNQEAIATYNDSIAPGNVVIAYGEQANLRRTGYVRPGPGNEQKPNTTPC